MSALDLLILICATGCGLIAGVFFAFSTSVMKALGKLPAAQGIAAMQAINVVIINPLFLGVFLGTAVACTIVGVGCWLQTDAPGRLWAFAGSVLYLAGSFFVTVRFNVPRNEVLARLSACAADSAAVWSDYLKTWTAWNHVRTVASLLAAFLFVLAAVLGIN